MSVCDDASHWSVVGRVPTGAHRNTQTICLQPTGTPFLNRYESRLVIPTGTVPLIPTASATA